MANLGIPTSIEKLTKISSRVPALRGFNLVFAILITAIISSAATFVLTNQYSSTTVAHRDQISIAAQTAGDVALTEAELIAAVKKLDRTVYWTGPMKGAKYTLNTSTVGHVYVRYLPNGKGLSDTAPSYRVIATYDVSDAFSVTQAASNQPGGVALISPEGAAVYYKNTSPKNVYLAFVNSGNQIEIYDPGVNVSINLANTSGALKLVR